MPPIIDSESDDERIIGITNKRHRQDGQTKVLKNKVKKHVRTKETADSDGAGNGNSSDDEEDERVHSQLSKRSRDPRKMKKKKKKKLSNKNLQGVNGGYAWEDDIQRSWDLVKVDDEGNIAAIVASIVEARKKGQQRRRLLRIKEVLSEPLSWYWIVAKQ